MRWFVYISGWILIVPILYVLLSGVVARVLLLSLGAKSLVSVAYISGVLALIPLASRAYLWAKARRVEVPHSFSGRRYAVCAFGVGFTLLAVTATVFLGLVSGAGGMSGVPLGVALMVNLFLCAPTMISAELSDWRSRREAK